jgi:hypothetical protein
MTASLLSTQEVPETLLRVANPMLRKDLRPEAV